MEKISVNVTKTPPRVSHDLNFSYFICYNLQLTTPFKPIYHNKANFAMHIKCLMCFFFPQTVYSLSLTHTARKRKRLRFHTAKKTRPMIGPFLAFFYLPSPSVHT